MIVCFEEMKFLTHAKIGKQIDGKGHWKNDRLTRAVGQEGREVAGFHCMF